MILKKYCEECDNEVELVFKVDLIKEELNGVEVDFWGVRAYCPTCGRTQLVEELETVNDRNSNKLYKEKTEGKS